MMVTATPNQGEARPEKADAWGIGTHGARLIQEDNAMAQQAATGHLTQSRSEKADRAAS